jgi:hypothetical protein
MRQYKFILSGGTGGHIYPYCYRNELKLRFLLLNFFVGAKDKWKCKNTASRFSNQGFVDLGLQGK